MLKGKYISTTLISILLLLFCNILSAQEGRTGRDITKFRAHTSVRKLLDDNQKKINLIEVISKNFGYSDYHKIKEDYTVAKIMVYQKKINEADALLKKNRDDIDKIMEKISREYEANTQNIIDECIEKINELKFSSVKNPGLEINRKLLQNEKKLLLANQQFDSAVFSYMKSEYSASITLYRSAKTHSIDILKELADPQEKEKINEKFKIHIVDNRNEIFNNG